MTKPEVINDISKHFVDAVRNGWNGELAYSLAVKADLQRGCVDLIDVLEAVEVGDLVTLTKDEAHETVFELHHTTVAGNSLRVTLSYDPHLPYLTVVEVTIF